MSDNTRTSRPRPSDASVWRFGSWFTLLGIGAAMVAVNPDALFGIAAVLVGAASLLALPPTELRRPMRRVEWMPLLGFFIFLPALLILGLLVPIPALWSHPPPLLAAALRYLFVSAIVVILFVEGRRFLLLRSKGAA